MNDLTNITLALLTSLGAWFLVFQTSFMRFRYPFPMTKDEYNGELLNKKRFLWYYHYNCEGCQAISTSIFAAVFLAIGFLMEGRLLIALLTPLIFLFFIPPIRILQRLMSLSAPTAKEAKAGQAKAEDEIGIPISLDQLLVNNAGRTIEPGFEIDKVLFFFGLGPCTFDGCQEMREQYRQHIQEAEENPPEGSTCATGCDAKTQITRAYMRRVKNEMVKQGLF